MFPVASLRTIVLCMILMILIKTSWCRVDVQKEYKEHTQCNGEDLPFPSEWMAGGLVAATQCADVTDEYCQMQCIVVTYPGAVKNGKMDMVWAKEEAKKVKLSPRNEKAKEELMDGWEKCAKPLPKLERPSMFSTCPAAKAFKACIENEFQIACKGKARS